MSEEQLNQPTPEPSQSPKPEVDSPTKSAQTLRKTQNTSSAVPKNQGIKGLIFSIRNLGKKGKNVAAEPPLQQQKPIAPTAADSATTPTAAVAAEVKAEVNSVPPPKVAVKSDRKKSVSKPAGDSFLKKLSVLWQSIVRLVRDLLPPFVNAKLSDPILNASLAAILIVAIGLTFNSFSAKPPDQLAKAPIPAAPQSPPTFGDFLAGTAQSPEAIANSQPTSAKFKSKLPYLVAPEKPQSVEIIPPAPLTPEQSLIAAIQNQVAEITDRLGGGLVKSVQADFSIGLLSVKVAEDWYKLSESEQNQLASQMWKEANSLDFRKLEIANLEGKLIARSPVVGSEMIVLERGIN